MGVQDPVIQGLAAPRGGEGEVTLFSEEIPAIRETGTLHFTDLRALRDSLCGQGADVFPPGSSSHFGVYHSDEEEDRLDEADHQLLGRLFAQVEAWDHSVPSVGEASGSEPGVSALPEGVLASITDWLASFVGRGQVEETVCFPLLV